MAATAQRHRAKLSDLPVDFSPSFLKDVTISLKSRQQGFKYFSEGYIHDVDMFRGDENTILTSAKSYRSMRKSEKPHAIHVDIKPTKISYVHCSCQAGAAGSCSHVVGFILARQQWQMMGFTEVPKQLSCTSLPQQWSMPRGPKIQPTDVVHMTFVNPKPDRKKRPMQNTLTDCRNIKVQHQDIAHLNSLSGCPISYLANHLDKTVDTHLGTVPVGSGLSTHAQFFEPNVTKSVGTACGNLEFPQDSKVTFGEHHQGHITTMTNDQCVQLEQSTRDQANSPLWIQERKHRLTASNFGSILKRKKITDKFISSILYPKSFTSLPTSYGKSNEKVAVAEYIKKTGNHVHDCGLIVNPKFPFLGATPDGKVCEDGKTGLLEVKCPYSARDKTVEESCNLPEFCLVNSGQVMSLKEDHTYYYQVQGQLMVSGAEFCDFVVFTRNDIFVQRLFPDVLFMKNMLERLSNIYFHHIMTALDKADADMSILTA